MPPPENYNSRSSIGSPGIRKMLNESPKAAKNIPKIKPELSKFSRHFGGADDILDDRDSEERME
jgi:hypothetical protein